MSNHKVLGIIGGGQLGSMLCQAASKINIKTKKPEFLDWKWIDVNEITEVAVDFKLHVYKELKEKVKKLIN